MIKNKIESSQLPSIRFVYMETLALLFPNQKKKQETSSS